MINQHKYIRQLQQRIAFYEDLKAYEDLYNLFFKNLQRFARSYVKCDEAAEEIVSDVFIKIWQIRNKLAEIENLKVYVYTITKNLSLNYISKNQKQVFTGLNEMEVDLLADLKTPEELCISSEAMNKIKDAIQQLPPQCRIIFQMVKMDGLKYKEAAVLLNVSVFTVRNQVAIAVKKIAEALPVKMLYQ